MMTYKHILTLLQTLGIILMSATPPATALPNSPVTPKFSSLKAGEVKTKVNSFKTPGGFPIWHVHTPDVPVVTLVLAFANAGDKSNPNGLEGISDYIAGMMDEGAGEYNSQTFKTLLLEKNIHFKSTSTGDHFYLYFQCTKENISDLFNILNLVLFELQLDPEAMERVRQQISVQLQQNLHSERMAVMDQFRSQAFPHHPYGRGTQEHLKSLDKITAKTMRDYMSSWFTQDNLKITVAGIIDDKELASHLDPILSKLPKTGAAIPPKIVEPMMPGTVSVHTMNIPQSLIVFYQPGISRQDPDFYAAYILLQILGDGGFKSRLWDEVRESRGLAYYISADLKWSPESHYVFGMTATANENVSQVIDLIRQEWAKILKTGVTQEELTFTKEHLLGAYPLGFTSTKDITTVLNNYQQDGLPADFISQRNAQIEKVTLEDVNRVAKKLIQPEKLSFVVVGKPEGILSQQPSKKIAQKG